MQPPSIQPIGPIPGGPIPTHTPGIMPDNHNSRKLAQVRLFIKLFLNQECYFASCALPIAMW